MAAGFPVCSHDSHDSTALLVPKLLSRISGEGKSRPVAPRRHRLPAPPRIDDEQAKSLCRQLLHKTPRRRPSIEKILRHPFLRPAVEMVKSAGVPLPLRVVEAMQRFATLPIILQTAVDAIVFTLTSQLPKACDQRGRGAGDTERPKRAETCGFQRFQGFGEDAGTKSVWFLEPL